MTAALIPHLGTLAVVIMVASYAVETRHPIFVLSFAIGCALAAFYAYLIGSMVFLIAEGIWAVLALVRFARLVRPARG